ncbi:vitamin K epoxide reductase family protein [Streptomyces netropsis]
MTGWHDALLAIPDPVAGLLTYGAVVALGVALFVCARCPRWCRVGLTACAVLGNTLCTALIAQAHPSTPALCMWLLPTWILTFA